MDTSRTSLEILKLSNRVERELMAVAPSHFSLLLAFTTTEGPARPLPSITMHAAGASACPKVSNHAVNFTGVGVCSPRPTGHSEFCTYQTRLWDASGLAANGAGPRRCTAGVTPASVRTRDRKTQAQRTPPGPLYHRNGRPHPGFPGVT